ncbi:MAG: DUF962 domain-containing protein [Ferruginibacter sp.]|nr:DUF962 domain-containing protein [Ferruginibacter sp.]
MQNIQYLLAQYGESHQHKTNKIIHWICVPIIFFSIVGFLYAIKLPLFWHLYQLNVAFIVTFFAILYYIKLSPSLAIGMFIFCTICLLIAHFVEQSGVIQLWVFCSIFFILAWIGQFYGHNIEGKKPSFLKDIQFLMIGPAWLMSFLYKKIGIKL